MTVLLEPTMFFTKHAVRTILANPKAQDWSVQGMGMLRCYLPCEQPIEFENGPPIVKASLRLHIWDSKLTVPNVSMMHTHPWDMISYVVAGHVQNERWVRVERLSRAVSLMYEQDLRPGEGGGLVAAPKRQSLHLDHVDLVVAGKTYRQDKEEIHVSRPTDGTVTLVYRVVRPDDNPDHAYTFWPADDGPDGWVSAEPREATAKEIDDTIGRSLDRWFL